MNNGSYSVARQPASRVISGFTLLELLVVLLIIALLAGYVGPKLFSQVDKAKVKTAYIQMKTIGDALGQYRLDTGHYPTEQQGLAALTTQPSSESKWHGPYMPKIPEDPWGHPYIWKHPGAEHEGEVISYGSNGQEGGTGDAADLVYGF